jgi:hypothetical protein
MLQYFRESIIKRLLEQYNFTSDKFCKIVSLHIALYPLIIQCEKAI